MAAAREVDYPELCGQVTEDEAQLYHRPFCRRYCKPVFPGNYQRVEAAAKDRNYSVIIYDLSGQDQDFVEQIDKAASQKVDGFLSPATRRFQRKQRRGF